MKFTPSADGIERATIHVELRLTRKEIKSLKNLAREYGHGDNWRLFLENQAGLAIEGALDNGV